MTVYRTFCKFNYLRHEIYSRFNLCSPLQNYAKFIFFVVVFIIRVINNYRRKKLIFSVGNCSYRPFVDEGPPLAGVEVKFREERAIKSVCRIDPPMSTLKLVDTTGDGEPHCAPDRLVTWDPSVSRGCSAYYD